MTKHSSLLEIKAMFFLILLPVWLFPKLSVLFVSLILLLMFGSWLMHKDDFYALGLRLWRFKATGLQPLSIFAVAALHAPNPLLMITTLLWGTSSACIFQKFKNIYLLAAVHAILAVSLYYFLPDTWHHGLRIGLKFFTNAESPIIKFFKALSWGLFVFCRRW